MLGMCRKPYLFFLLLFFANIESEANDSTCILLLIKAKEYIALEQWSSAIPLLDSCIKINKNDAGACNLRACATIYQSSLNDEKNNRVAIGFLTQAIQNDSSNSWYYNNRGWSYQMLDKYAASLKDFKRAMSLDTSNVYFYGNILRVLWLQNKKKEAYAYSDKIIGLFPNDGYAYYVRGQLKRDYLHKYPEGNKDIKKSEELGWLQGMQLYY
jgi:tetratricopeptide (TPR) repeat protein